MAALAPSPPAAQPPPVPQTVDPTLGGYLQQFSLWCRHGFAAKLNANSALPGVLLQASDAPAGATPKVFLLQVHTDGTLVVTPQPLGAGKP
jgi:hypothetical protein